MSPLNHPAAANFFEVCAVMRVNLKNAHIKVQVGEKIDFLEGGGGVISSKLNIHPRYEKGRVKFFILL